MSAPEAARLSPAPGSRQAPVASTQVCWGCCIPAEDPRASTCCSESAASRAQCRPPDPAPKERRLPRSSRLAKDGESAAGKRRDILARPARRQRCGSQLPLKSKEGCYPKPIFTLIIRALARRRSDYSLLFSPCPSPRIQRQRLILAGTACRARVFGMRPSLALVDETTSPDLLDLQAA